MITKSLTQTSSTEIMQIIKLMREFISDLTHRPTGLYFGDLATHTEKRIKFLESFLEKRVARGRQGHVTVYKEIHCIGCKMDFTIPLKAVLSSTGYVRYYRDDTPHECPSCGWREVEGQGMIIIRFNE